jgi:hypothetical protein
LLLGLFCCLLPHSVLIRALVSFLFQYDEALNHEAKRHMRDSESLWPASLLHNPIFSASCDATTCRRNRILFGILGAFGGKICGKWQQNKQPMGSLNNLYWEWYVRGSGDHLSEEICREYTICKLVKCKDRA